MLKAGGVAAVALTLLVPTFNALNLSYVENVTPPPWMPTPKDPPNITPPTDFEPPPDFEPPDDWEGEVPPGACPPPVVRVLNETRRDEPVQGPDSEWTLAIGFELPEGALALEGWVNFTQWRASSVSVRLVGPQGFEGWADDDQGSTGTILTSPTPKDSPFHYKSYEGNQTSPVPAGDYILTLRAAFPLDGRVTTIFGVALACGGLMSR